MSGIVTGAAIVGGASLLGGVVSSIFGARSASKANDLAKENMRMQNAIAEKNLAFQKEEAAKLEK